MRFSGDVRVPIDRGQYAELAELKDVIKMPLGAMVKDAIDWWLEAKAPVLRQPPATFANGIDEVTAKAGPHPVGHRHRPPPIRRYSTWPNGECPA